MITRTAISRRKTRRVRGHRIKTLRRRMVAAIPVPMRTQAMIPAIRMTVAPGGHRVADQRNPGHPEALAKARHHRVLTEALVKAMRRRVLMEALVKAMRRRVLMEAMVKAMRRRVLTEALVKAMRRRVLTEAMVKAMRRRVLTEVMAKTRHRRALTEATARCHSLKGLNWFQIPEIGVMAGKRTVRTGQRGRNPVAMMVQETTARRIRKMPELRRRMCPVAKMAVRCRRMGHRHRPLSRDQRDQKVTQAMGRGAKIHRRMPTLWHWTGMVAIVSIRGRKTRRRPMRTAINPVR